MSPPDDSKPDPRTDEGSAPAYAAAGVDLDKDEGFIDEIKEITRSTLRPEVLSTVGGFAGLFKAPERYNDPVFVAGADGVGTKLKLAAELGRYDTVGIDCVAMVVNDLVVQGAEPLVFLDYLAMDDLDPAIAKDALRGVAEGCRRAGCALLGGETASMPGFYGKGDLELVGFGVGVVERDAFDRRLRHQPRRQPDRHCLERHATATATPWCAASSTTGVRAGRFATARPDRRARHIADRRAADARRAST